MTRKSWQIMVGLIVLLLGGIALCKTGALEDPLLKADFSSETGAGATNAVTGLGNGRLTVGISPWSELIYFRWPTPSFHDHLRYLTVAKGPIMSYWPRDMRYGDDAPSLDWRRYGRPYEKYPGLGARGGIYLKNKALSWFGDESWTSARAYEPEWGPVLCTALSRKEAQIKVCQWVDWDEDVLVQDFRIDSDTAQKFFYYGTFDPYDQYDSYSGYLDTTKAGFATVYLPDSGIILYFLPKQKDQTRIAGHLGEKLTPEAIDKLYPEGGEFVALGFLNKPDGFQVGADRKGRSAPAKAPLAASEDAKKGKLSGSSYFLGQSDSGLEKTVSAKDNRVTVFISAGASAAAAVALIERARAQGVEALRTRAVAAWKPMADKVALPESASPVEQRVARRSILNLFMGRDKQSGAIIASPSHQPNYHSDWPRDGSFYDLALDLAGFSDMVTAHLDFYRRFQRKEKSDFGIAWITGLKPLFYSPRGHWWSNMATDGTPGDMKILPIEIDETSLLLWDLWRHEKFVPESERKAYEQKYLEMLTLAADAVMPYVDEKKGWTKKVFEDDNAPPTATLHGASSVLAGLSAAADAGARWGADPAQVEKWKRAAVALRAGILKRIEDDRTLDRGGWRGLQWTLFPAPVFESYADPAADKLIQRLSKAVTAEAGKERPGFAYLGEKIFILRLATLGRPEYQPVIANAVKVLANEAPMPGTDCFGEVTIWIEMPGQGRVAQQRTSIPHLWTGVTSYLAVEALYQPEKFLDQIPPVPK